MADKKKTSALLEELEEKNKKSKKDEWYGLEDNALNKSVMITAASIAALTLMFAPVLLLPVVAGAAMAYGGLKLNDEARENNKINTNLQAAAIKEQNEKLEQLEKLLEKTMGLGQGETVGAIKDLIKEEQKEARRLERALRGSGGSDDASTISTTSTTASTITSSSSSSSSSLSTLSSSDLSSLTSASNSDRSTVNSSLAGRSSRPANRTRRNNRRSRGI